VVKAFNHLPFEQMMSPVAAGHRRVLFVSGDDADAKASVMSVIRANGFAAVDLGSLASGSRLQQVGGPLASLDLLTPEATP
jgi:predicted dinucleotide-binding enzyme